MKHTPAYIVRAVQAALLLIWLAAYGWLLSGEPGAADVRRFHDYLNPKFWPLLTGSLALLALLLIGTLARSSSQTPRQRSLALWLRVAILLLPLVYLGASSGQMLGASAAAKRSVVRNTRTAEPRAAAAVDVTPGGLVTLLELREHEDVHRGHEVETLGMVYQGDDVPDGHCVLFQFVITCCVADAQPVGVFVAHPEAAGAPSDTWLKVRGELTTIELDGETVPCIQAREIARTEPPPAPYLFAL